MDDLSTNVDDLSGKATDYPNNLRFVVIVVIQSEWIIPAQWRKSGSGTIVGFCREGRVRWFEARLGQVRLGDGDRS